MTFVSSLRGGAYLLSYQDTTPILAGLAFTDYCLLMAMSSFAFRVLAFLRYADGNMPCLPSNLQAQDNYQ